MAKDGKKHVSRTLAAFFSLAVILGVIMAGLGLPAAAMLGIGASSAAKALDELPEDFDTGNLSLTTKILDANGGVIATVYDQNRVYRPLSQISQTMIESILGIEDYRFYQHGALDPKGTLRALITNKSSGGTVQGGSSITQQLVKLTLLYQAKTKAEQKAATDDSYSRKIRELRYAMALEAKHSKNWILEQYLNTAYFGDGAYGVQAAAQRYFGVNSDQLSWTQAATLAGLVKNPTGYDPTTHPDAALTRRNTVLERLAQLNVVDRSEIEADKKLPLGLNVVPQINGCVSASAPWFCDYAMNYLMSDPDLGATTADRRNLLFQGGLTIKTTLQPANQTAANAAITSKVAATDNAVGAVAETDPRTGNVLALAQSRPMGNTPGTGQTFINYTIPVEDGGAVGFQPGSTFKAFTLAAAMEQGVTYNTQFNAQSKMTFPQSSFANCPGAPNFAGTWTVNNLGASGVFALPYAYKNSVNTYFAQLEQKTGVCAPFQIATKLGVQLTNPTAERIPSFTLGVDNATPLEIAGAYGTFGNRGVYCKPRPILEIDDANGKKIKSYDPQCSQVLSPAVADAVNGITRGYQDPGGNGYNNGTALYDAAGQRLDSGGKTGTTDNNYAVWYTAYTPAIATSLMVAGADSQGHPISLNGQNVGGVRIGVVTGTSFATPIWALAMKPIMASLPDLPFTAPDPAYTSGQPSFPVPIVMPDLTGMSQQQATDALTQAKVTFTIQVDATSTQPNGTVISQSVAPGTTIDNTVSVVVVVSGYTPPAPPPTSPPPTSPPPATPTH